MTNAIKIFATDLDRTLIYSNRTNENIDNLICVEHSNNKEITYMTEESLLLLNELKKKILLIPVTTRSVEQFKRISVVNDSNYAITSNGGTILKNGEILKDWETHISHKLQDLDFTEPLKNSPIDLKLIDNVFYYTIIDRTEPIKEYLNALPSEWHWTIQGRKLYIIPKIVSKEHALDYLLSTLKPTKIITAGDGQLDTDFIKLGQLQLVPKPSDAYSQLQNQNITAIPSGITNVPKLLHNVLKF